MLIKTREVNQLITIKTPSDIMSQEFVISCITSESLTIFRHRDPVKKL